MNATIQELLEKSQKKQEFVHEAYEAMHDDDTAKQIAEFSTQFGSAINHLVDERESKGAGTPKYFMVIVMDQLINRWSDDKNLRGA